jgi:RNA polymerase sigma-70 factor (ECF subfamily)
MDAVAIEALLEERRPQVIRYAMRLCISPQDAEDATQEALLALSKHISALRELAALSRWLFLAVRTHCTRLARRSLKYVLTDDDGPALALEGDTPEEQLVDRQLRHRLAQIVSEMPADLRDALVACDFRGDAPREAAEAMGISEVALKSRLHRARAEAKKRLLASISRTSRRG